jgi:glucosamine--fructose-6-phosphate aminotransferase (isomerizing)
VSARTVFEQEIRSQGGILHARSVRGYEQAELVAESWRDCDYALVAARGSSDNAATMFQYVAGRELGLLVALATPSLYESGRPIGLRGAVVVGISQSGRSPGIAQVLERAAAEGRPRVVLTNDPDSPLARLADHVIDLAAGPERAIASTKTFSATWQALAQLVSTLGDAPLEGLDTLPAMVDEVVAWALNEELPLEVLDSASGLTVVGRGVGYAVAQEAALKIREVSGTRAEAYAAPDYLHGPIGAASAGGTLLLVVGEALSDEVAASILADCRRLGMRTVALRHAERRGLDADAEIVLTTTPVDWCLGLAQVVVAQVLALRLGQRRGRPIDTAPGLSKVTSTA